MGFNKKGVTSNTLIVLVTSLVFLVIMWAVIQVVFVENEGVFTNKICQVTVYLADQTLGIGEKFGFSTILCSTYYKEMEDVEKEEFLHEIAENARKCWWMWGEGERDPAGENILKWGDSQCFNCYKMEPLGKIPDITLSDLQNHLQKETLEDSDLTYWNYFKGFRNNQIIFNFPDVADVSNEPLFKKDKFYSVTYIEATSASTLARIVTGTTGGAIIGAKVCSPGLIKGAIVCGLLGGAVGGTVSAFENYFIDKTDGIMISEFETTEEVCSGELAE